MPGIFGQWQRGWRAGASGDGNADNGADSIEPQQGQGLSFLIITHEADYGKLEQCVQSIPPGAEVCIVVTEQGKESSLSEITHEDSQRGHTVKVRTWTYKHFSFAQARNYSLEMASNDWCIWLDSDDILHSIYWNDLQQLHNLAPGIGGVECCCAGYQPAYKPGEKGKYYGIPHLRAFRKSTGAQWRGLVHEQLAPQIELQRFAIIQSGIVISHSGYVTGREQLIAKVERNIALMCRQLATSDYCTEYYQEQLKNQLFTLHDMKGA